MDGIKIFGRTIDDYMITGQSGLVIIGNLEFLKNIIGNTHEFIDSGRQDVYFYNSDESAYFGGKGFYFDGMRVLSWLREKLDYHEAHIDFLRKYGTVDEEAAEKIMINKHYTFKTNYPFILNGDVQKMIADYCTEKIVEIQNMRQLIQAKEEARKKAAQEERDRLMNGADWSVTEKIITDEGGKTKEYLHTITINGNTYRFTERNIFDFGRVINPYPQGGFVRLIDGCYYAETFDAVEGWKPDRKLSDDETRAYLIIDKYGKFKHSGIRM